MQSTYFFYSIFIPISFLSLAMMTTFALSESDNEFWNLGAVNIAFKQLTLVLLVISMLLLCRIFITARFRPAKLRFAPLAPAILVYMLFHIVGAVLSIPYNIYAIVTFYLPNYPQGNEWLHFQLLFWLGQWQNSYNAISPLVVLFLTIERCIVLWIPGPVAKQLMERWLLLSSVAAIAISFASSTGFYLAELPLELPAVIRLGCETVSCLMLRYRNKPQLFFKCAVGVANISSCLLFLYTLRKYSTAAKQIRNRSVVITIVFETLLNIVPAFFCLGFSFFGSTPISNVVSMTSALDACCCAIYYTRMFLPWNGGISLKNAWKSCTKTQHRQNAKASGQNVIILSASVKRTDEIQVPSSTAQVASNENNFVTGMDLT